MSRDDNYRGEALLENISVEAKISRDQVDWLNSLEEKLMQVQEDLSFYNNILEEFMVEDIVSLKLDFRSDITQESNAKMTIADAAVTADIIASVVILDDVGVKIDSYA